MIPKPKDIRKSKRESLIMREMASLFIHIINDDARLQGLFVNRVALSPEQGMCAIMFYVQGGKKVFDEKLEFLKLYKPSVRKAIANILQSRYTPEIVFKFDEQFEKQLNMDQLFNKLKDEGQL